MATFTIIVEIVVKISTTFEALCCDNFSFLILMDPLSHRLEVESCDPNYKFTKDVA